MRHGFAGNDGSRSSRRRDGFGPRKVQRHWTERQELRGDDLALLARTHPEVVRSPDPYPFDEEDWDTGDLCRFPRDASLEAWERQAEARNESFDLLREEILHPLFSWTAPPLIPEQVDEMVARLSVLLPRLHGDWARFVEQDIELLTGWTGVGLYADLLERRASETPLQKLVRRCAVAGEVMLTRGPHRGPGRHRR